MILLSTYRSVCFEGLTCYLYHGCIGPARIPTIRDSRLVLISVWVYPWLMVERLSVTTLSSPKSAIWADSPFFRICIGYLHTFYLFLSWLKASMFLNQIICIHAYLLYTFLHAFMIIDSLDLYNWVTDNCRYARFAYITSWTCWISTL
jgi:Ni,Fe-hydrogenase I cytochrome b subunit